MITILIHRWHEPEVDQIFEVIHKELTVPHKYNRSNHAIELKEGFLRPIVITGRYGSVYKMRGLRPDFYSCSSREAEMFLLETTSNIHSHSVKLNWLSDVLKIIDILKIGKKK